MPRQTRLFLAGNTVSMAGTGLVIAFTLIYLHQVRGLALPVVGALLAASAAAGLIVMPAAGVLLDQVGARRVLTGILVGQAVAQVLLACVGARRRAVPDRQHGGHRRHAPHRAARRPSGPAQPRAGRDRPDPGRLVGGPGPGCPPDQRGRADRRGRANSMAGFGQSLAFIVSPAVATGLIAAGAPGVWIALLCAGCLGMVAVGAALRRTLTVEQDRVQPRGNVINKSTAPRNVLSAGESWTLTDQPHMHVLQERMPPGQAERRHLHRAVEQLYYILDGVATVRFDEHEETLRSGDAVYVPAAALHQLRNDSPEALEFLVISSSPPRTDRVDLDRA
jgi:mannose-6-phosphate isomerase-like protein (cupin superfamily)